MQKTVAGLFAIICMAFIACCGGSPSASNVTVFAALPIPFVTTPPFPPSLGGAHQVAGGLSFSNHSTATFSGSSAGFSNHSTVTSAKFNRPIAVTSDGTYLYVADSLNNAIRRINIATGFDTTIAGNPFGLAGSTDGTGAAASFNLPRDITTDGTNLYVADSGNFTIRKIDPTGLVTTIAGSAGLPGSIDATIGTDARFNIINGITTDGISLYVTDSNNTIRRIVLPPAGSVSSGPVTTLAGVPGTIGSADGTQGNARFNLPNRITTDGPSLYVTDFNNSTIRKIALATGAVTTIAGQAGPGGAAGSHADSTDADPTGRSARFNQPNGITTDGTNLYVTDSFDNTVRQIIIDSKITGEVFSGKVTTIAGAASGTTGGSIDGHGSVATFNKPIGITTDGISLYITDNQNHRIRRIQH